MIRVHMCNNNYNHEGRLPGMIDYTINKAFLYNNTRNSDIYFHSNRLIEKKKFIELPEWRSKFSNVSHFNDVSSDVMRRVNVPFCIP